MAHTQTHTSLGNRPGNHLGPARVGSRGIEIESHGRMKDSTTNTTGRLRRGK